MVSSKTAIGMRGFVETCAEAAWSMRRISRRVFTVPAVCSTLSDSLRDFKLAHGTQREFESHRYGDSGAGVRWSDDFGHSLSSYATMAMLVVVQERQNTRSVLLRVFHFHFCFVFLVDVMCAVFTCYLSIFYPTVCLYPQDNMFILASAESASEADWPNLPPRCMQAPHAETRCFPNRVEIFLRRSVRGASDTAAPLPALGRRLLLRRRGLLAAKRLAVRDGRTRVCVTLEA